MIKALGQVPGWEGASARGQSSTLPSAVWPRAAQDGFGVGLNEVTAQSLVAGISEAVRYGTKTTSLCVS